MTIKGQERISQVLLVAMILVIFSYGILVFYIPAFISLWMQTAAEHALSVTQRFTILASDFARRTFWIVGPFLALCFVTALVWRINCFVRLRKAPAA